MFELRHLVTLDAVAAEGTFGKAAERLGYTQSAVSQQIAALEKSAAGAVFDRPGGPRPVRLTPLGRVLLDHGRDLLTRAAAVDAAVERFRAGEGRVDIGTFQSVTNTLLPPLLSALRAEHPAADVRLVEDEPDVPGIGELDLLFYDGEVSGDVVQRKIMDDPYALLARRGDYPPGPVPLAALDGVAMVAQPAICDQARVERAYAAAGVAPKIVFRTADNQGVVAMVRAGLGVAVLPALSLRAVPADDLLSTHDLSPALEARRIHLAWPDRTLSPLAQRVIALAEEVAGALQGGPGSVRAELHRGEVE
jgi:DNA-binding transcriptional LysR family regulator